MTTGLVEEYEVLDRNIADWKVITHYRRETYFFGRACLGTQRKIKNHTRRELEEEDKEE